MFFLAFLQPQCIKIILTNFYISFSTRHDNTAVVVPLSLSWPFFIKDIFGYRVFETTSSFKLLNQKEDEKIL